MTLHSAFSRRAGYALATAITLVLVACGGGGGGGEGGFFPVIPASSSTPPASTPEPSPPPAAPTYAVSGTVTGLLGTGLVLQNNAGDDLPIAANGRFSFATPLAGGASYTVSIKSQSKILTRVCTVANGSGTIAAAAVDDVQVVCTEPPSRFAYVSNGGSNSVSAYTVDASTGALRAATTLSVPSPYALTVDPSGRFVYVSSTSGAGVSAYSIDRATGDLTAIGAPSVAVGGTSQGWRWTPPAASPTS
ncbi:beta-propeller fold lactonase family protein [Variovorax paradoxus]|uniref:beta-propeller fold lactonase family protein n=1 Tax=Variovorax paradoxus TaxID=34073 RepID=UPI0009C1A009|nr:beta-propeller fold lactonase family protein [Variovorax paradoxus]